MENTERKQRNSNVEMLRIVIMFGILLWHVTWHGFGLVNTSVNEALDYGFMNSLCISLFAPSVDLFVLISGYYSIKLRKSSLLRMEVQAVFYSYLLAVIMYFMFRDLGVSVIRVALPVLCNHWWFLSTYVLLMFAAPVINEGVKKLTERQHLLIILSMVVLNGVGKLLNTDISGYDFLSFIIVYLTGQYLSLYKDKYSVLSNCETMLTGGVICFAINFMVSYYCLSAGERGAIRVYTGYCNPVILLYAVFVLCFVLSLKPVFSRRINAVAKHVLAVYLVTEALGVQLYKPLKDLFVFNFFAGLGGCVLVFLICILVEAIRSSAYDRLVRRVRTYIHRPFFMSFL